MAEMDTRAEKEPGPGERDAEAERARKEAIAKAIHDTLLSIAREAREHPKSPQP